MLQEKAEAKFRVFDGFSFFFDHVVQSSEVLLRPDKIANLVRKLGGTVVNAVIEATHVVTRKEMKDDIIKLNSPAYKNKQILTWAEFYDRVLTRMDELIDSLYNSQTELRTAETAFKIYMIEQDPFHETSLLYKQKLGLVPDSPNKPPCHVAPLKIGQISKTPTNSVPPSPVRSTVAFPYATPVKSTTPSPVQSRPSSPNIRNGSLFSPKTIQKAKASTKSKTKKKKAKVTKRRKKKVQLLLSKSASEITSIIPLPKHYELKIVDS